MQSEWLEGFVKRIDVGLVQMQSKVGNVAANLSAMKRLLHAAAENGAQIVCFPEASLTGYSATRAEEIALPPTSPEVRELFDVADMLDVAVCFGLFERAEDGKVYIAQPLHAYDATLWHRKTHLGEKEQKTVSPGQTIETIDIFGIRFGVQICWETHFPELSTIQRAQGAEVVLMPFASGISGQARRDAWLKYLPARATDNGMYVLATNALLDPQTTTSPTALGGGAMAIDPYGKVIGERFMVDECVFICDLYDELPRNALSSTMGGQSYFDCRRPELFEKYR
ncbi:MAG: nitrilase-related carbon-nitrogen hydrolase [Eggerthellaceae bacterium]|nr:nitrilase-related carbon-nitrogen hydrolase [Eggerthellaceae bacterium]